VIVSTLPEPAIDVAAQMKALRDPTHPKDAVWIAAGTTLPEGIEGVLGLSVPEGVLLTTSRDKAKRFQADPSDETLADILGYAEPKSVIAGAPYVVQARDEEGAVVLEMAASAHSVTAALSIAGRHGEVRVMSLPDALARRIDLWRKEA